MKRIRYIIFSLIVGFNAIYAVLLQLNPNTQTTANYLFNSSYALIFIAGSLFAFMGFRAHGFNSHFGKGMFFYMIALLSYSFALFIWTFYNVILKQDIPYPGIADFFFMLFEPASFLGFIFVVKGFGGQFTKQSIIEFVILFAVIFTMIYSFLSLSSLGPDLTPLARIFNILYPTLDAMIFSLAITGLRTETGKLHIELLIFVFAAIAMALADTMFSYRAATGIYWNGDISDVIFMIAGALSSIGILTLI